MKKRSRHPWVDRPRLKNLKTPSFCFVSCIEAGLMEKQAVMLAESMRLWGGMFASCPYFMVNTRAGMPISRDTQIRLRRLGVEYLQIRPDHSISWYGNLNKSTALSYVEKIVNEEVICWLDTDMLIVNEPLSLELAEGIDFKAMPASVVHDMSVPVTDDSHQLYWEALCANLGLQFQDMPVIPSLENESVLMKMYWQTGVHVYRRETQLGALHLDIFLKSINGKIGSREAGVGLYDQSSLAIAVGKGGFRWELLPISHHFSIDPLRQNNCMQDTLSEAAIIHYSGSKHRDFFRCFVSCLVRQRPDVASFIEQYGPLMNGRDLLTRSVGKVIQSYREWQFSHFESQVTLF